MTAFSFTKSFGKDGNDHIIATEVFRKNIQQMKCVLNCEDLFWSFEFVNLWNQWNQLHLGQPPSAVAVHESMSVVSDNKCALTQNI